MRKELRRPFPTNNTGRAGEASSTRATRGAPLCASMPASWWIQRRPPRRECVFPRSGCGICRDPPAAAPPAGKFPMLPKRVCRACRNAGGGMGDRRSAIRWKAREASAIVRLRSSAAPDAHAHAGHASRTLFANATADTFLRSISAVDILYCSISNAEYATAEYAYAAIT